ncbi:bifunctional folylpolyglutamate synthase/dihydrofolate synthase [Virgibacillus byunsanensis]|uniref:tetrahydrofolate synthase n=1 Tax=Virgibacillus byunsanensis TaxID=570945 RepID=A0ABW3LPX5_9BACI
MFKSFQAVEFFFNNRKNLGIKPGLDRINGLLELLNNPQDKIKMIHVAGTNGKGSTIQYLKQGLLFNHYRVGVFTSPSLHGLTGHVCIDHSKITEDEFIKVMNEMYPAIDKMDKADNSPTEFEIITALAFVYFADKTDIAIIETGMGGREDTTNCFQPILSIITNVSQDHTAFLGHGLEEIAYHKAGIIKEKVPVVIGEIEEPALTVMSREAQIKNSPMYQLTEYFQYKLIEQTPTTQSYKWSSNSQLSVDVTIQMHGKHQVMNSSLAIMGLDLLKQSGMAVDWQQALEGIYRTRIHGRFEIIRNDPTIILDGAHNLAGVKTFIETVLTKYKDRKKHLVFAVFKDKDIEKMLHELSPYFSTIILTTFDHPRAVKADSLYQLANNKGKFFVSDWESIVKKLDYDPANSNDCYFFTGSLHFIATVRKHFEKIDGL